MGRLALAAVLPSPLVAGHRPFETRALANLLMVWQGVYVMMLTRLQGAAHPHFSFLYLVDMSPLPRRLTMSLLVLSRRSSL